MVFAICTGISNVRKDLALYINNGRDTIPERRLDGLNETKKTTKKRNGDSRVWVSMSRYTRHSSLTVFWVFVLQLGLDLCLAFPLAAYSIIAVTRAIMEAALVASLRRFAATCTRLAHRSTCPCHVPPLTWHLIEWLESCQSDKFAGSYKYIGLKYSNRERESNLQFNLETYFTATFTADNLMIS